MVQPVRDVFITAEYGIKGSWDAGYHTGRDYRAAIGTPVMATRAGKVIGVGNVWGPAYGLHIVIESLDGDVAVRHAYCHLSSAAVNAGEKVTTGQLIGKSGNSGNTTGPHLHYEERLSPFLYNNRDRRPTFPGDSENPPKPAPKGVVFGIDINHFKDPSFLTAKAQGVQFAVLKCTEGQGWTDPKYRDHLKWARNARLYVAAYHWIRSDSPVAAQAENLARNITDKSIPVAIDCEPEEGSRPTLAHALEFINEAANRGLKVTLLYLPRWYWAQIGSPSLAKLPAGVALWQSDYGSEQHGTLVDLYPGSKSDRWAPFGGRAPVFLQFASTAEVGGEADVDVNAYRGNVADLSQWFQAPQGVDPKPPKPPKPPRPPEPDPEPEPPAPQVQLLRIAEISMQYDNSEAQKAADAASIFARAQARRIQVVAGTEASEEPLTSLLDDAADEAGYRFHENRGQWISVARNLISGGWETGYEPVLESTEGTGVHTDRGITWVAFDSPRIGRVTIGSGHYLRDGRNPGDPNYELNRRYAQAIGEWGKRAGAGADLVFYAGDQNTNDRIADSFRGEPFTSAQDELKKHPSTGHGPIDVVASWNRDGRVSAVAVRVHNDKKFPLNTDHYLVVADFSIRVT